MLKIGTMLNQRYRIERLIGNGGTASVYLARDLILERYAAVKILRYDLSTDDKAKQRFHREARAVSELYHDNIVNLYDVDEEFGQYQYLVMEYINGTDLRQYIRSHQPIALPKVVAIMEQILSAVSYAHQRGIIHRDLKTQNILVDKHEKIKITDFGIATILNETSITQTNTLIGSIHYLSPEQARGGSATKQSDIYALGVILYELIIGAVPFTGDTAVSIAMKHFQSPVPDVIGKAVQTVPQSLENVVLKAMAKNPENRYETCEAMLSDLRGSLKLENQTSVKYVEPSRVKPVQKPKDELPVKKTQPVVEKGIPTASKKRSKKWLLSILGLVGISTLLASFILFFFQKTPDVWVPEVSGLTKAEAIKQLSDLGLIVENIIEKESDSVESGKVISSNPKAQTMVKKNSHITLQISNGALKVTVEDYKQKEYSVVYDKLIKQGFIVERKSETHATVKQGYIIDQSIEPDTKIVPKGQVIVLTVSTGAIKLSNYVGTLYEDTVNQLKQQGFMTITKTEEESIEKVGTILGQSIAENTEVDPSSTTLTFRVSGGIKMPDLLGSSQRLANNRLTELGIVNIEYEHAYSDSYPEGTLAKQSVVSGTAITKDTKIVLTISLGSRDALHETTTESSYRRSYDD